MDAIISQLKKSYPALAFDAGNRFTWSPKTGQIIYRADAKSDDKIAVWSLMHEAGHALLKHRDYYSDFHLLDLEIEAWQKAKVIGKDYGYFIDSEHIEDCLDTYRDWLYQRSTCPACTNCSLQIDRKTYCCFNCGSSWKVSSSRLCRPYRRKQKEILI